MVQNEIILNHMGDLVRFMLNFMSSENGAYNGTIINVNYNTEESDNRLLDRLEHESNEKKLDMTFQRGRICQD